MLDRGVTVDGVDEHAKTALWHAAEGRDATLAGWLIHKGAMPARLPMAALTVAEKPPPSDMEPMARVPAGSDEALAMTQSMPAMMPE